MVLTRQRYVTESDIQEKLVAFNRTNNNLLGLESWDELTHFAALVWSSVNDLLTASEANNQTIPNYVLDPSSKRFDPLTTAGWYSNQQNIDEACWLLFLHSYIGKHAKQHWHLLRSIYGSLDSEDRWTWEKISTDCQLFLDWILENQAELSKKGGLGDGHKHYGLDQNRAIGIGNEILSYVTWVKRETNHVQLLCHALDANEGQPTTAFHYLYQSISKHTPIKKSINFNFLALIGSIGVANIEPEHLYLNDILLPKQGAKRLLGEKKGSKLSMSELNEQMVALAHYLEIPFGVQVLQKALEKWANKKLSSTGQQFIRRY